MTVMQLLLPLFIYFAIQQHASIWWWALSFFMYVVVYSMIGNNIALHRYFTHGHATYPKIVEYAFLWVGAMTCLGEPVSYAMTHLVHHKYPDTVKDPHGLTKGWRSFFPYFHRRLDLKETPMLSRRLAELSKKYGWLHNYYVPFVLFNAGLLYLIDIKLFLFCWAIPASMTISGVMSALLTQHLHGKANNGWNHKWFWYYEALHLNHHDYPNKPNTALTSEQVDYTYEFSKLFFPKFNGK